MRLNQFKTLSAIRLWGLDERIHLAQYKVAIGKSHLLILQESHKLQDQGAASTLTRHGARMEGCDLAQEFDGQQTT
eukprot:4696768-Amphidinium_carterae.1